MIKPACPFCKNIDTSMIDRVGDEWFCQVCSSSWRERPTVKIQQVAPVLLLLLLAGCALNPRPRPLPPWSDRMSDGCSIPPIAAPFFPVTPAETACCVIHDRAYYFGGRLEDRRQADAALAQCWIGAGMDETKAALGYTAVELGGGPEGRLSYSWAYGGKVFRYTARPAATR